MFTVWAGQKEILQNAYRRTSELVFKFMVVLLGLLQLILDVIHILRLTSMIEFEIRFLHTYCLSALHLPSNVSEFAL